MQRNWLHVEEIYLFYLMVWGGFLNDYFYLLTCVILTGKRGLADFLASATKGTKLGAAFDVINAFGKVSKFIKDLKNIAPAAHKALTNSIKDIKNSMNNITSKLTGEIESNLGK